MPISIHPRMGREHRRGRNERAWNKASLLVCVLTLGFCLQAAQLPVTLNSAGSFTALASSTVTNTGPTIVNGNVGLFPGSAVTGFPPGSIVGGAIHAADATAGTAQTDLTAAYNDAAGRTVPTIIVVPDIGGQTLPAGLYKTGASPSVGITGTLTLDGGGNSNAVFIFQIASTLTTASGSQVVLINGANAANIFWQVGSSATLGTTSIFQGTILAQVSVTVKTGASLNGRALARTGAVTLDSNAVVNPGPPITNVLPPVLSAVSCPLPGAVIGVPYNSLLVATGGTAPFNFFINAGTLPAGLNPNASTGAITGTPTGVGGTSNFSTNATDSAGTPVTVTNNTCSIVVTAASSSADVSIIKTGPATSPNSTNITYSLAVANAGPSSAAGVTVTDILPAGTTFVSATPSQGTCSFSSAVVCPLGTMANGATATIALVVAGPSAAGTVVNTATVVSTTPDANTANNTSTWNVTVTVPSADVSITKTGPASAAVLANITYNLAVANAGPISAAAVTVTDALPAGTTFVSATPSQGTCSFTTSVVCPLGTMANGATATIALVLTAPSAAGTVVNTATVASTTPDSNSANNSSTWNVTVSVASSDVSIVKTGPASAANLSNITYSLAVANAGPISATGVTVTDALPAGTTFVSATPSQGSCLFTTSVVCTLGTIASSGSATISLVLAGPSAAGTVVNTATVASTTSDTNLANNTSTWNVAVTVPSAAPALSTWGLGLLALLLAAYSMRTIGIGNVRTKS